MVVSVGLVTTKVLSKVATELAKQHEIFEGVVSLVSWPESEVDAWLKGLAIEDVWGIGKRLGERLRRVGIVSARGLKEADHAWIRHAMNVGVQRVVL
ncbi:hypothetical protein [Ktedonobacter racemifer]|uniref:hypothetical protein n=1 Tax=Ktedonobacter racemifer TaxID=363277 RepID=UPI00058FDFFF|nr:hypothetical protein [Ktedonobacter racemifer]